MDKNNTYKNEAMDHLILCTGHQIVMNNIVKASNCYLYDSDNKEYIDFESGVWCTPLGHGHPRINQVIKNQVKDITHTGFCYLHPVIEESARQILEVLEIVDGKCVFLCSGSEAVEFGVQVIQTIYNKPLFLTMSDSYLGSYGTANKKPENEWFLFDWLKCTGCSKYEDCDPNCSRLNQIPFQQIKGFVFEPGSSSGLVRFPPLKLVKNITHKIKENNGLIMVNEVTTGVGRTGRWFGHQYYNLKPDIVALGKGLGNGYPVSAAALTQPVWKILESTPFKYSQSHQNDPLGAVIAKEVIQVIKEENLIEKCSILGSHFKGRLHQLQKQFNIIKDVRGRGLIMAIEFEDNGFNMLASIIQQQLLSNGFIVAPRPGFNVIRIDPPLTVSKKEIDSFIENFLQILTSKRKK
jgi:acetylornithine aminotransferase